MEFQPIESKPIDVIEIFSTDGKRFDVKKMSITEMDNRYLYEQLNYQHKRSFYLPNYRSNNQANNHLNYRLANRLENQLDKNMYFEPTLYYIETPTGKLFLKLNREGVIAYNQNCSTYVRSECKYVTCNVIINNRKLFEFLQGFLWRQVYVNMTPNGLFLFVEFEDPFYCSPEYKLHKSFKFNKNNTLQEKLK